MSINELIMDSLEERLRELNAAARSLVDAVERYTRQECLRSELINIKNEVKAKLK